jgi:hypothetical protein
MALFRKPASPLAFPNERIVFKDRYIVFKHGVYRTEDEDEIAFLRKAIEDDTANYWEDENPEVPYIACGKPGCSFMTKSKKEMNLHLKTHI